MDETKLYDVIIVGGGPAGLTAALYLARGSYRVLVVEKQAFGGQITITSEVANYPGVMRQSGKELTETMKKQAEQFGAEFLTAEVVWLDLAADIKCVRTNKGDLHCFGVLIATGAHPRMVGFDGEETFKGRGVAYCATCDGEFFSGKDIFVVGGGFAAAEESVFLTKYAKHVTILMRGDDFSCPKTAADKARANEKITVLNNTEIVKAEGDDVLRRLIYKNNQTGEMTAYEAPENDTFGIFVFAGYEPETALVKDRVDLDEQGYIITDADTRQTSVEGVYAAGDVCIKKLRQVVTAVGDGAVAATELERYAARLQKKTGKKPCRPEQGAPDNRQSEAGSATAPNPDGAEETIFSKDVLEQLDVVFSKMEQPLILKLYLDERSESRTLAEYVRTLASRTDHLQAERAEDSGIPIAERPCVTVCLADGTETGLAFHGVPGGHEFASFVMGLYDASNPGLALDEATKRRIAAIDRRLDLKIFVTLSCGMCPELVMAAQKIAVENEHVTAKIYDISLFPSYQKQYHVMSVPCLVVNDEHVSFGRRNLNELLDDLETVESTWRT